MWLTPEQAEIVKERHHFYVQSREQGANVVSAWQAFLREFGNGLGSAGVLGKLMQMKTIALGILLTILTEVVVPLLTLPFRLMDLLRLKNAGRKRPVAKAFGDEELVVVKALAAEKSYSRVEWLCWWDDYDIFSPIDETMPDNPMYKCFFPELILLRDGRARWTSRKETSSSLGLLS